jgi:hypothetical protein
MIKMKRNDKILQEAFFKKSSYADKLKRKFPQYEPQDKLSVDQPGFGAIIDPDTRVVTDAKEAKKRLTGAFGVVIGSNSVKNIASRAVKSFPIVISDNIEPETSVMLKRLFEEQYAEYINLLISNQVIDISAYTSGEEGNIAIQALDTLSGVEFGNKKIARQASKGKLDANDFFKNISAYSLIRQENKEYKTGVPILDSLLEGAAILPQEKAMLLSEYMTTYPEELVILEDDNNTPTPRERQSPKQAQSDYVTVSDYLRNIDNIDKNKADARKDIFKDASGHGLKKPSILINPKEMNDALDITVAEMLLNPKNEKLKDRFEKATFLLQSNRISGNEYIEYLIMRLGIPLSDKVRRQLVTKFKEEYVRDPELPSIVINKKDAKRLFTNQKIVGRELRSITSTTFEAILKATARIGTTAAGAVGGYLVGGGSTASLAAAGGTSLSSLAGAAGIGAILSNPITLAIFGGVSGLLLFNAAIGGKGIFGKIRDIMDSIRSDEKRRKVIIKK